jgi:hypothetical protein
LKQKVTKPVQSRPRLLLDTSQFVFEEGMARQVIAEAHDGFMIVRLCGLKAVHAISWGSIYGNLCIAWLRPGRPNVN